MASWIAAIVETGGRADFWSAAAAHGVSGDGAVPAHVLIDCSERWDFTSGGKVAAALSAALGTAALGFAAQTGADAYRLEAFRGATRVRLLEYARDAGGWMVREGEPQPWEHALCFTDDAANEDMLGEDATGAERERYAAARTGGGTEAILELVRPTSTAPFIRICRWFGVTPDAPAARWQAPRSRIARWFGRR